MESNNIQRITSDDDPRRCQGITPNGQCINKSVENGSNCLVHGGNKQEERHERQGLNNYRLTKYQAQLKRFSQSPGIKSLRDEVGILRMILEEKLNQINDNVELVMSSSIISDLVIKINTLVVSCHKL